MHQWRVLPIMHPNSQLDNFIRQLSQISTTKILEQLTGFPDIRRQVQGLFAAQSRETDRIVQNLEALRPMLSQIADATKSITAQLVAAHKIAADMFQSLRERLELDEGMVKAFNSADWPIAPSMPPALRQRVVELYNRGEKAHISQVILGYYRGAHHKYLIQAVNDWHKNRLFEPRMHILADALSAHCEGRYTLSVPALMAQIDGLLIDYVFVNGLAAQFGKIKEVYEAAIGDPLEYDLATYIFVNTLKYQLQTNTYAFVPFEAELQKSDQRRKTNRHTVLHGVTSSYDRPIHSLRAFLLLDSISVLDLPED